MDALQNALRGLLSQALDQRSLADADLKRSGRVLRISLVGSDGPSWTGESLALMQPALSSSRDARWGAAIKLSAAAVPRAFEVAAPGADGPAFGYPQLRDYGRTVVGSLRGLQAPPRQVGLPLPGLAHGLDEGACLEHLLLGLVDALAAGPAAAPPAELVLLEPNPGRRRLLAEKLGALLGSDAPPAGWSAADHSWPLRYFPVAASAASEARPAAPFEQHLSYDDMLTAFVAMPFKTEMRDVFLYGIQGPARRNRFKAERLDFEHYTGSVVEQIKERIQRAHLVLADITGANANVFLEIGYAWGKGRPTVLLRRAPADGSQAEPSPFDVAADSRIDYADIGSLDKALSEKLQALYPVLRQRALGSD